MPCSTTSGLPMLGCCGETVTGIKMVRIEVNPGPIYLALDGSSGVCSGLPAWRFKRDKTCLSTVGGSGDGDCRIEETTLSGCSPFAQFSPVIIPPSNPEEYNRLISDRGVVLSSNTTTTATLRRTVTISQSRTGGPNIQTVSEVKLEQSFLPLYTSLADQAAQFIANVDWGGIPPGWTRFYELTVNCGWTTRLAEGSGLAGRAFDNYGGAGGKSIVMVRSLGSLAATSACRITKRYNEGGTSSCSLTLAETTCQPISGTSPLILDVPVPPNNTTVDISPGACPGGCNQAP